MLHGPQRSSQAGAPPGAASTLADFINEIGDIRAHTLAFPLPCLPLPDPWSLTPNSWPLESPSCGGGVGVGVAERLRLKLASPLNFTMCAVGKLGEEVTEFMSLFSPSANSDL